MYIFSQLDGWLRCARNKYTKRILTSMFYEYFCYFFIHCFLKIKQERKNGNELDNKYRFLSNGKYIYIYIYKSQQ